MSKVMLRLRNLTNGEAGVQELANVDEAIKWLGERPENTEVLGVVFEGITREDNERMKRASRPLTADEAALISELEEQEKDAREKRDEEARRENEANQRAAREAAKKADPNRPMELRYRFNAPELEKTDALDERPITEEGKSAVIAWVNERQEWVAARGQAIGEAKVTVYPGPIPAKAERVVTGSFVPVTAAAPKPS